ncbi:MAG: NAD(P)H-binding protein [Kribbellaceae bacterium]
MDVVIAGGHGKIALLLTRLLSDRGDRVTGIVRNPAHPADVEAAGGKAFVLDLEQADPIAIADVLAGADAGVFAAGAGPGSGAARKETVDRGAAVKFAEAAERTGVRRHLQVSAMGLHRADDPSVDEVFRAYLRAKAAAEEDLRSRDLDWTILRPGRLTDAPGTGLVEVGPSVGPGSVSRADVAAVLAALLDHPGTSGKNLEVVEGKTTVAEAVSAVEQS